jgi:Domain of unknown function (DUF5680)
MPINEVELLAFVIRSKKATYVGSGGGSEPSRVGSRDLTFADGPYRYRDSYFGGTDFLGQEVVWHHELPTWVMNYYGYIVRTDLIEPTGAGNTLKAALSQPNAQGRLLDNFTFDGAAGTYEIRSSGTIAHFSGRETIHVGPTLAYALDYHGGLVKE